MTNFETKFPRLSTQRRPVWGSAVAPSGFVLGSAELCGEGASDLLQADRSSPAAFQGQLKPPLSASQLGRTSDPNDRDLTAASFLPVPHPTFPPCDACCSSFLSLLPQWPPWPPPSSPGTLLTGLWFFTSAPPGGWGAFLQPLPALPHPSRTSLYGNQPSRPTSLKSPPCPRSPRTPVVHFSILDSIP